MKSIFTTKSKEPIKEELKKTLSKTFEFWEALANYAKASYPSYTEGWTFSSAKYGWSFRIADKKRVLIYLLPRDKFFKVAFVFGQKATDKILNSTISDEIKDELCLAKVYAEGRGIRLEVKDNTTLNDIMEMIKIKIEC